MKKKLIILLSLVVVMCGLLCACDNSSSIRSDLDSGWDKFMSGDIDSMTPGEKAQVEGFLEYNP